MLNIRLSFPYTALLYFFAFLFVGGISVSEEKIGVGAKSCPNLEDTVVAFLKSNRFNLPSTNDIADFYSPSFKNDELDQYKKWVDGIDDQTRIKNALASISFDFAVVPCDLDGDGNRDLLVQTHASDGFGAYLFTSAARDPFVFIHNPLPRSFLMEYQMEDHALFCCYTPESDDVGWIGLAEGQLRNVDVDPYTEMDGPIYGDPTSHDMKIISSDSIWLKIGYKDDKGLPGEFFMSQRIFEHVGFSWADKIDVWDGLGKDNKSKKVVKELQYGQMVNILDHRDGYFRIPSKNAEDEDIASEAWVSDEFIKHLPPPHKEMEIPSD